MSEREWPEEWLPILTKPLCEWTPEDFKQHVRGLYKLRKIKKPAAKKRFLRDLKVTVRRLKRKGLSAKTKRDPKYVTRAEYEALAKTHPENELFIALKAAEIHIYETHDEAERIRKEREEMPW